MANPTSRLVRLIENDFDPASDTSAFSGAPAADAPPTEPTPGDFLDGIAEQLFNHLADTVGANDPASMNAEVDALLEELRQRLVNN